MGYVAHFAQDFLEFSAVNPLIRPLGLLYLIFGVPLVSGESYPRFVFVHNLCDRRHSGRIQTQKYRAPGDRSSSPGW
jgi:hypothetical protein